MSRDGKRETRPVYTIDFNTAQKKKMPRCLILCTVFPVYTLMCIFKIGSLWVFWTLTLASKYPVLNTQPKQTTSKKNREDFAHLSTVDYFLCIYRFPFPMYKTEIQCPLGFSCVLEFIQFICFEYQIKKKKVLRSVDYAHCLGRCSAQTIDISSQENIHI